MHPTPFGGMCLRSRTIGCLARFKIAFICGLVTVMSKESGIGRGGLHVSDERLVATSSDNVDEVLSRDFVVWEMCHSLPKIVREASVNENRKVIVQ